MVDEFINSRAYKKIFAFHGSIFNRLVSRESTSIEFKESFDWKSKDEYSKTMASFANNKGGHIVFGIKNRPRELVGLQTNNFEVTDEAKISSYLNSAFSPEIEYEKFVIEVKSKTVGIIHVFPVVRRPIICIKNDGDIREAEIYYRYNASTEKIKYPELSAMIEQIRDDERASWRELFGKISQTGVANVAILDTTTGEISGSNGTLLIEDKLIPKLRFINEGTFKEKGRPVLKLIGNVKPVAMVTDMKGNIVNQQISLTDDPNAPAVRLTDDKIQELYPMDYSTLKLELKKRYSDFKENQKFHNIRKSLMSDKDYSYRRLLNPKNPDSSHQDFYSTKILKAFDAHYKLVTK